MSSTDNTQFNLSRWALEHPALTRYLMVVLMVLGMASYFQLGQDEDPPFTFRAMVVRAYWPGATAEQMAEQVTDKLERTLQEVPFADKIRSYSKPGEAQIIFQIKDNSKPGDVPQVWYSVRKKIGDMRGSLPPGVVGPFFNDEFGDVYGVIYALSGQGFTAAEVKTQADSLRQSLLRVPDVAKVELFGAQDEKVFIEVSQKKLAQMGLDMGAVLAQLNQQNAVESAGSVQSPADVVQVRVGGQFQSLEDLKALPIRGASGAQIRLSDIATVSRGYADPASVKVRHDGHEVIALGVSMAKGGDIIALGKSLRVAIAATQASLPAGMSLTQVQDQPSAVSSSVNEFIKVLIEAVVIVLAVSFLALGLHKRPGQHPLWRRWTLDIRPGLVVGITIPLVLAVTFLAMYYFGIGLHKISLGSLIIALGLLVDDAIIAVEMMLVKIDEGSDRARAAAHAWSVTAAPLFFGTFMIAFPKPAKAALFALEQPLLAAALGGDVLDLRHEMQRLAMLVAHQRDRQSGPDDLAIAIEIALFQVVVAATPGQQVLHQGQVGLQVIRMGETLEIHLQQFFPRIAEDPAQRIVDVQPSPFQ